MRPTLRQLQYLVMIADTGRFGDAAKRLYVSQPSLSAQIAELETELGTELVERGRHGAFMTPMGEEIVRRARLVLSQVQDMKAVARQAESELVGRFRLGVLPSIGPYLLPTATKRLHAQFPDFRLEVREENTLDLERHLSNGQFDLIISNSEDHPGRTSFKLLDEKLWICIAPDDPLSNSREPIKLTDLKKRSLLTLGPGHALGQLIADIARRAGGHVSAEYQGTSLDATRQMAMMGAGIAVLPSLYTHIEAKRDPDTVVRLIDHPKAHRGISLIWREQSPLSSRFELLARLLKETASDLLA